MKLSNYTQLFHNPARIQSKNKPKARQNTSQVQINKASNSNQKAKTKTKQSHLWQKVEQQQQGTEKETQDCVVKAQVNMITSGDRVTN